MKKKVVSVVILAGLCASLTASSQAQSNTAAKLVTSNSGLQDALKDLEEIHPLPQPIPVGDPQANWAVAVMAVRIATVLYAGWAARAHAPNPTFGAASDSALDLASEAMFDEV